jgi:hypothetical protein
MKIKFLVAEEVRPEVGGKFTVLGLIPDEVLIFESRRPENASADIPDGIERLALLLVVSELGDGVHKFKGQIYDPNGEPYNPEIALGEGVIEKGTSRSMIIELKPFVVKKYGIYRFDLYVDDKLASFSFEIRSKQKN